MSSTREIVVVVVLGLPLAKKMKLADACGWIIA
jgi:hypothetical protein